MKGAAWVPGSSKLAADLQLAALVEQIHSNVEAIQLCTAFYISHAYIEVIIHQVTSLSCLKKQPRSPHVLIIEQSMMPCPRIIAWGRHGMASPAVWEAVLASPFQKPSVVAWAPA